MVDVAQLQSSIINRDIAEQKRRPVPLLYRRFTDQFEQPTDTTLLQAMLLALTGKTEDIPNVVKATDNSQFSANIKALNPKTTAQAQTGQEHRHNQVKNGVTVGSDTLTTVADKTPDAQGGVKEPSTSTQKAGTIRAQTDKEFGEKVDSSVKATQSLYNGHLNLRGAQKMATEDKLAQAKLNEQIHHPQKLKAMADGIAVRTAQRNAQIKNLISEGDVDDDAVTRLEELNKIDAKITKQINQLFREHSTGTKEISEYKNADGNIKGSMENDYMKKVRAPTKTYKKKDQFTGINEDLSRIIQNEVYKGPDDRQPIRGFSLSGKHSDEENIVYIGKDKVLMGIRGSYATEDWVADLGLMTKKFDNWVNDLIGRKQKGPENPAYQVYLDRLKREQTLYDKLKKAYPDKEFILGGHSYGGSIIKGLSIANNQEFSGYTYNSFLHPEFNDDHKNIKQSNIFGDVVSLFEETKDVKKLDHHASIEASVKIMELLAASKIKGAGVDAFTKYIGKSKDAATDALIGLDEDVEIAEYLYEVRPYLEAKEGMKGLKRGTGAYRVANTKLQAAIKHIKEHPAFGNYDFSEAGEFSEAISDFTPNTETIKGVDKLLLKEKVLKNVLTAFKVLGRIGEVMLLKDIIVELHSSKAFKPLDEGLAMWDAIKSHRDDRLREVFNNKLDIVGLEY